MRSVWGWIGTTVGWRVDRTNLRATTNYRGYHALEIRFYRFPFSTLTLGQTNDWLTLASKFIIFQEPHEDSFLYFQVY